MITLIHTRCSHTLRILDCSLTALGWSGFIWLGLSDALALTTDPLNKPSHQAFIWFAEIFFFSLLVLVSWSVYNKSRYRPRQTASAITLDTEALSSSFHLPTQDVRFLQDSRVCVIHHEANGAITQVHPQTNQAERLRLIA